MVCFRYLTVNTLHKDDNNNNNKTCLLIDIDISDNSKVNTKETGKKDLEIKANLMWKVRAKTDSNDWSIRNNYGGIRPEPSVAPRSPAGHRTTDHTNEHRTHHSVSAGVNRIDFLLRYVLEDRYLITNRREQL